MSFPGCLFLFAETARRRKGDVSWTGILVKTIRCRTRSRTKPQRAGAGLYATTVFGGDCLVQEDPLSSVNAQR